MIANITIDQLLCFHAVVSEGGFQGAAEKLLRAQPTVSAAVKTLESQLGLQLLDRSGYRVALTESGRSFHERTRLFLDDFQQLQDHAQQLASGAEAELRVVVGDLCPLPQTLGLLREFFAGCPETRLNLYFEALAGPAERLFDGEADLILHHIDKADARLEFVDLFDVELIPVVAPKFLRFPISTDIAPEQMRDYVQCVIRDSARRGRPHDYYLIEGARRWTVSDQLMKRELIAQGMGWGHLPRYLIEEDLSSGRLVSIAGEHFLGGRVAIVAARRRAATRGPVAERLWKFITSSSISR